MNEDKELERHVALTVSAILIAIAAFSLPIMVLNQNAKNTLSNEMFGLIGLFSIVTSSLLIDSLFDENEYTFINRLKMMNGGYTLFAIVISIICTSLFIIYNLQEENRITWHYVPFVCAGVTTFGKIMSHDKKERWLLFLCSFYIWSIGISLVL